MILRKSKIFKALAGPAVITASLLLTGCFDDNDSIANQYKEWRELNQKYIQEDSAKTNEDGSAYYTKVVPSWAPDS